MNLLLDKENTENLIFRRLEETDFDDWLVLFSDEINMKYLELDQIDSPIERCKRWFSITFDRYKNNEGGQNALIDKSTNKLVGQAGLLTRVIDGQNEIEIAYSILPKYRNMGFATEAAKKCRDFAFANKLIDQLFSIIHIENTASESVALNIGMKKVNTGKYNDMQVNFYKITYEEWKKLMNN